MAISRRRRLVVTVTHTPPTRARDDVLRALVLDLEPSVAPAGQVPHACAGDNANGMEYNGMEWNGMEWNGMEWNTMEWNGMEWNRMQYHVMDCNVM